MKHKLNDAYIDVIDQEYADDAYVAVTLVVNGKRMPFHRYDFYSRASYILARRKALALGVRLAKQLKWRMAGL